MVNQIAPGSWMVTLAATVALGSLVTASSTPAQVIAQIVPDNTLPVNSSVIPGCTQCLINGGTERGVNLYHSFREFSVPTGGEAWFNNATQIQNILTRVTGSNLSTIDGLLKTNGTANLFFLNPNGIVFGPNARLQIGGSFFASTANSFKFSDGSEFSATTPQAPPLLTINVPLGLQYGKAAGEIEQLGDLAVPAEQSLTLYGTTVTHRGTLTAPGGTVQVLGDRVALLDHARIDVSSPTAGGTVLVGGDFQGKGILPNAGQTLVSANAVINADATQSGNGGKVVVWSDQATGFYGTASARGGSASGDGGQVEVSSLHHLTFAGTVNTAAAFGNTGTLLLDPTNIRVVPGKTPDPMNAQDGIWSFAEDPGDQMIGADAIASLLLSNYLTLQATDTITFKDVYVQSWSANDLTLTATHVIIQDASLRQLGGGDITINATNSAQVISTPIEPGGKSFNRFATLDSSTYGTQNAGNITINANSVAFSGWTIVSSNVENGGNGAGGTIGINANSLSVLNGAQIQAILRGEDANGAAGNGTVGTINIDVTGAVLVSGLGYFSNGNVADARIASDIGISSTSVVGEQRDVINIKAGSFTARDGATIATTTYAYDGKAGEGDAGNINIQAKDITLTNATVRSNIQQDALGKAGNIYIAANNLFTLSGTGVINLDAAGVGDAGSITISAGDVKLTDEGKISATTTNIGNGGNIAITAQSLSLSQNAQLKTSTQGQGDAGRIELTIQQAAKFDGNSGAFTEVESGAVGNAGGIGIRAGSLAVTNGARLSASTFGEGAAGSVKLTVSGAALFDGMNGDGLPSGIFSQVKPGAVGKAGGIEITAGSLTVTNSALLSASTFGQGDAGGIKITADTLSVNKGASLDTSTFGEGDAGSVKLTIAGTATVDGKGSALYSQVEPEAVGKAGGIEITAGSLAITNGALLSATTFGEGNAGSVKLTIAGSALFDGMGSALYSQVNPDAMGKAGGIEITASSLAITNGAILSASTLGEGDAGSVKLTVSGAALFDGMDSTGYRSGVFSQVDPDAVGKAGGIEITAGSLAITNGALLSATTFGEGNAGSVKLTIAGTALFDGKDSAAYTRVEPGAVGNAGGVEITAGSLAVTNGAILSASTFGEGDAGSVKLTIAGTATFDGKDSAVYSQVESGAIGKAGGIEITAGSLAIANGAALTTSTFGDGDAGNITVNTPLIQLTGSTSGLFARASSSGKAGNLILQALTGDQTLSVLFQDGAQISASTTGNQPGGNIIVTAPQAITIAGSGKLAVETSGSGTAGNMNLTSHQLTLKDGVELSASTTGSGNAGNITATAERFDLLTGTRVSTTTAGSGGAGNITVNVIDQLRLNGAGTGLFATTTPGSTGNGGNIVIDPRLVQIQNGAAIAVDSRGSGTGGSISLIAGKLELSDRGSITAETASAQGGNITLEVKDLLLLRRNSLISATAGTAQASGNGGNITIRAPFIIGVLGENSDITANAFTGNGGKIDITTNAIYGLKFQPRLTPFSDITASSQFGLSGTVAITTLNTDPNRGLVVLPGSLLERSNQIQASCSSGRKLGRRGNQFVITGRGGVPESPEEMFGGDRTLTPLIDPLTSLSSTHSPASPPPHSPLPIPHSPFPITDSPSSPIIEAQGWIITPDGTVHLVAQASTPDLHPNWQPVVKCPDDGNSK